MMPVWTIGSGILEIRQGDLTEAAADAVVNAANSRLAGGGGVDGAIHRAAGPGLPEACREIVERIGSLPAGGAVITPGFRLKARWIIHTVGPVWRGGGKGEPELLESAYAACLRVGAENGVRSLAFPAVSCGAYGYPPELAAPLALETLARGLADGLAAEAAMVLHGRESFDLWTRLGAEVLGTPS